MRADEISPGMECMTPGGCVRVLRQNAQNPDWWDCEYLWTRTDPRPHPSKKFTSWDSANLTPKTEFDKPPTERVQTSAQMRGEWPRTLTGGRP